MVVRFACSGSESPALAAGVQLEVAVAAVVAGVEILARVVAQEAGSVAVAATETAVSVDVVIEAH